MAADVDKKDVDRLIAAMLTASHCQGSGSDMDRYMRVYRDFLGLVQTDRRGPAPAERRHLSPQQR